jgi:hypothetical protein
MANAHTNSAKFAELAFLAEFVAHCRTSILFCNVKLFLQRQVNFAPTSIFCNSSLIIYKINQDG